MPSPTPVVVNLIMAYEAGDLTEEGIVALFQHLVDTGMAWRLQGHYGRTAMDLIEAGHVNVVTTQALDGSIQQNVRTVTE